jgi:hypothetical protein
MVACYLLYQREHNLPHHFSLQWLPPILFHYLLFVFKIKWSFKNICLNLIKDHPIFETILLLKWQVFSSSWGLEWKFFIYSYLTLHVTLLAWKHLLWSNWLMGVLCYVLRLQGARQMLSIIKRMMSLTYCEFELKWSKVYVVDLCACNYIIGEKTLFL